MAGITDESETKLLPVRRLRASLSFANEDGRVKTSQVTFCVGQPDVLKLNKPKLKNF